TVAPRHPRTVRNAWHDRSAEALATGLHHEWRDHAFLAVPRDGTDVVVIPGLGDVDFNQPHFSTTKEVRRVEARAVDPCEVVLIHNLESVKVDSGVGECDVYGVPRHLADLGTAFRELIEAPLVFAEGGWVREHAPAPQRDGTRAVTPMHVHHEYENRLECGNRQDAGIGERPERGPVDCDQDLNDESQRQHTVH